MSDYCCRVDGTGEAAAALPICDAEHMARVRDGHDESFAFLLEKHRASVIGFLYRMLQNHAQAEDLAQEVFMRVYRLRRSYQPSAKFTTWLLRIATNLALNARRDGRKELFHYRLDDESCETPSRQVADTKPTVEQDLLRQVRLEEVRRAVAALPGRQRAAVLMHKYEEMSYTQIAEALDCSVPSVKSLLFRAHETLRTQLADVNGSKPQAARSRERIESKQR